MAACDHAVGEIANRPVNAADWNRELLAFIGKVHRFNTLGQRIQIEHPGWVFEANFCPWCGEKVSFAELGLMRYHEAYDKSLQAQGDAHD